MANTKYVCLQRAPMGQAYGDSNGCDSRCYTIPCRKLVASAATKSAFDTVAVVSCFLRSKSVGTSQEGE